MRRLQLVNVAVFTALSTSATAQAPLISGKPEASLIVVPVTVNMADRYDSTSVYYWPAGIGPSTDETVYNGDSSGRREVSQRVTNVCKEMLGPRGEGVVISWVTQAVSASDLPAKLKPYASTVARMRTDNYFCISR